jgi:hypothetical protein
MPKQPRPHQIDKAPRDGTLVRFWCRSEAAPMVGYWSRRFIGRCAYREAVPLICHDVTGCEPIEDQAAPRAVPVGNVRRRGSNRCCRQIACLTLVLRVVLCDLGAIYRRSPRA